MFPSESSLPEHLRQEVPSANFFFPILSDPIPNQFRFVTCISIPSGFCLTGFLPRKNTVPSEFLPVGNFYGSREIINRLPSEFFRVNHLTEARGTCLANR